MSILHNLSLSLSLSVIYTYSITLITLGSRWLARGQRKCLIRSLIALLTVITLTNLITLTTPIGVGAFYIENIRELLDVDREWFLDKKTNILYYKPINSVENTSPSSSTFMAGSLKNIIEIRGVETTSVENVSLSGLTVSHSAPTYLDKYEVPSGMYIYLYGYFDLTPTNNP